MPLSLAKEAKAFFINTRHCEPVRALAWQSPAIMEVICSPYAHIANLIGLF